MESSQGSISSFDQTNESGMDFSAFNLCYPFGLKLSRTIQLKYFYERDENKDRDIIVFKTAYDYTFPPGYHTIEMKIKEAIDNIDMYKAKVGPVIDNLGLGYVKATKLSDDHQILEIFGYAKEDTRSKDPLKCYHLRAG